MDRHVGQRQRRLHLIPVTMASVGVAVAAMVLLDAPAPNLSGGSGGSGSASHAPIRNPLPPAHAQGGGPLLVPYGVAMRAPSLMTALVVAMLATLGAILPVTAFWKISVHTSVAAGAFALLAIGVSPW